MSTIVPELEAGPNLPPSTLSYILSPVSLFIDGLTRLRYRRAELSRLVPAWITSDPPDDSPQWISPAQDPESAASVLRSPATSQTAYRLTLPDGARITAECRVVAPAGDESDGDGIEFTLAATVDGREFVSSCRAFPTRSSRAMLRLRLPVAGAATIVLATRPVGQPSATTRALWGNPRVEWRRPVSDAVTALAEAVRGRTLTALGRRNTRAGGERLYRAWIRATEPSTAALELQRRRGAAGHRLLTLITPLTGTGGSHAGRRPLESLLAQSYPHWEWIVLTTRPVTGALARAERDPRIRVIAAGRDTTPAGQLTRALQDARGEFAALLGERDALAPSALFSIAESISSGADVIYSDEDRIDDRGTRSQPAFKPEWSPDLLLAWNYVGGLAMIKVTAALDAGGFRDGFGGAAEWELLLRLSRLDARFQRLPACLYHRHAEAPAVARADRDAALGDHGRALGLDVEISGSAGAARVRWALPSTPRVSVVIPNRNAYAVLKKCVDGLLGETSYPNRELIIVDNGSAEEAVLDFYAGLERAGRGRIVPFDRPFNFSAACNVGAAAATGDLLLFLNNDIEVIEPDWMEELVRWAVRPGVGVVGAKLLYPDRLIQHAGVVFGLGLVGHIFGRASEGTDGVFGSTEWYRNYLAVTGACQMVPRPVFTRLGGYDEQLRLSFSDVVLCMEARRIGYRVVYTPHARLIHHESYTRQKQDSAEDMDRFARYLRRMNFVEDPYLHPQLDPKSLIPSVRPPFDPGPSQVIADFIERVLAAAPVQ